MSALGAARREAAAGAGWRYAPRPRGRERNPWIRRNLLPVTRMFGAVARERPVTLELATA